MIKDTVRLYRSYFGQVVIRRRPSKEIPDVFWFQSTNGILVNSRRVERNVFFRLEENDIISFVRTGSLNYRFVKINTPCKNSPSPVVDIHPSIVQSSSITPTLDDSVAEISPQGGLTKSPKRKTGTGSIDHVNP